jgi:hypothetical protein
MIILLYMSTRTALAIFVIAASMVTAITTMSIPALAAKSSASHGLNIADQNIHQNTGALSKQDLNFHVGTCQGGHSTAVLDSLGGCSILPSPKEFHSPQH